MLEKRGLSCVNSPDGFKSRKEIEPEDNIERDSQRSSDDYDTELDTDELIGNHFNNTSSNNSFENQERMLGSINPPQEQSAKKRRPSGGIKCLRNLRRSGVRNKPKQGANNKSGRKKKVASQIVVSQIPKAPLKLDDPVIEVDSIIATTDPLIKNADSNTTQK